MTDRSGEEDDAEGRCPPPVRIGRVDGAPGPAKDAADATPPATTTGSTTPAWPPLVHVPDCDRSELLRRIVGG